MQNKTDKGTSLVSKSLPVKILDLLNRLFSARKKKYNISWYVMPYRKERCQEGKICTR